MSIHEFTLDTNEFIFDRKMYSPMNSFEFASWLQQEMNKRGWNNSELARRAGVTRGAIGNVLRGDRNTGSELCLAISKALNIPPETVFRAAGLFPPERTPEEKYEELLSILDTFTEEQRKDVLRYVRFVLGENEKSSLERKTKPRTGASTP
jgi:transcriptional regulator with XRE-family HTH domain